MSSRAWESSLKWWPHLGQHCKFASRSFFHRICLHLSHFTQSPSVWTRFSLGVTSGSFFLRNQVILLAHWDIGSSERTKLEIRNWKLANRGHARPSFQLPVSSFIFFRSPD